MKFFSLSTQAQNILSLLEDITEWEIRYSDSFLYHKSIKLYFYHPFLFSIHYNEEDITKFFSWYELYRIKKEVRKLVKFQLVKFKTNQLIKETKAFHKLGE